MSIDSAYTTAQLDWKEALDPNSVQALDERLGILVATITMPSGIKRPVLYWNALSFPLTFDILDRLLDWKADQQQKGEAA